MMWPIVTLVLGILALGAYVFTVLTRVEERKLDRISQGRKNEMEEQVAELRRDVQTVLDAISQRMVAIERIDVTGLAAEVRKLTMEVYGNG